MKTWNDYKEYVGKVDEKAYEDVKEAEELASIIAAMVEQRNDMGLSWRDLAKMCGLPWSSIARIESCKTIPNLKTLLNIFGRLGLSFSIIDTKHSFWNNFQKIYLQIFIFM